MQTTTTAPAAPVLSELPDEPPDRPPVQLDAGPTCLCGAQLTGRQTACRKCRARNRWHRRNRLHDGNRRRTDTHRTTALLMGGPR